jgi:hypothetical protein
MLAFEGSASNDVEAAADALKIFSQNESEKSMFIFDLKNQSAQVRALHFFRSSCG